MCLIHISFFIFVLNLPQRGNFQFGNYWVNKVSSCKVLLWSAFSALSQWKGVWDGEEEEEKEWYWKGVGPFWGGIGRGVGVGVGGQRDVGKTISDMDAVKGRKGQSLATAARMKSWSVVKFDNPCDWWFGITYWWVLICNGRLVIVAPVGN